MSSADNNHPTAPQPAKKVQVKVWHVLFLAVLIVCTWALAWWQWTRFQSGSGSFQNLGYALQWPFFGLFFVYAYRKILAYEREHLAFEAEQEQPAAVQKEPATTPAPEFIDESFLPQREQLTIEEFNQLNQPRRRKGEPQ